MNVLAQNIPAPAGEPHVGKAAALAKLPRPTRRQLRGAAYWLANGKEGLCLLCGLRLRGSLDAPHAGLQKRLLLVGPAGQVELQAVVQDI